MEIIDAHQHFWIYKPETHGWIDESMGVIRRDFLPEHLRPILQEYRVSGTIAVQADQSLNETTFLLDLASQYELIMGVVGWVDLMSDDLVTQLDDLAHYDKLVGFRHIVQGEDDPLFVLRPEFRRGLEMIFEQGYTYDLLIYPHQLVSALELLSLFPDAPIVIDHIAKPWIKAGFHKGWASLMKEISQFPKVYCKWSGMITEADWSSWKPEDIRLYLDVTAEYFTVDRLMYGSDWPVLNVAGTYGQVIDLVKDYIEDWSRDDQQKVMSGNTRTFYLSKILQS